MTYVLGTPSVQFCGGKLKAAFSVSENFQQIYKQTNEKQFCTDISLPTRPFLLPNFNPFVLINSLKVFFTKQKLIPSEGGRSQSASHNVIFNRGQL